MRTCACVRVCMLNTGIVVYIILRVNLVFFLLYNISENIFYLH